MEVRENPESYTHPLVTFSNYSELSRFVLMAGLTSKIYMRYSISSIFGIEFPYETKVNESRLNKVLGTAMMFEIISPPNSAHRLLNRMFIDEISGYYKNSTSGDFEATETDGEDYIINETQALETGSQLGMEIPDYTAE